MATQSVTYKTEKIMPTREQLVEMGRELQFYPSVTEHPEMLTLEQLADFNRVGYIKDIPIFSESEIGEHRQYFDNLFAYVLSEEGCIPNSRTSNACQKRLHPPAPIKFVKNGVSGSIIGS